MNAVVTGKKMLTAEPCFADVSRNPIRPCCCTTNGAVLIPVGSATTLVAAEWTCSTKPSPSVLVGTPRRR